MTHEPNSCFASPRNPVLQDGLNTYLKESVFTEPGEHARALGGWDQSYVQLSAGRFVGTIRQVGLGSLNLVRETTNRVIHEQGRMPGNHRIICVPISMTGLAYFNGLPWTINSCTSLTGEADFDLVTADALELISISVDCDLLGHYFDPSDDSTRAASSIIRLLPRQLPSLLSLLGSILQSVASDPRILQSTIVRNDIKDALCEVMADILYRPAERWSPRTVYSVRRQIVWDAIEYVRSDAYGNVSVSDLCRLLRINRRTLQEYFLSVVNLSPKQYLLAYRLNKVRGLLVGGDEALSIREAAMRWGFWHLSDFASNYKRLFQELPSSTVDTRRSLSRRRGTESCELRLLATPSSDLQRDP
ncbi:MAG TPA: helix-turn-helix domain-containing protein [Methylibium sp.]|nr:helix-turn-helix domain-containing protein [Methylibium sp.]